MVRRIATSLVIAVVLALVVGGSAADAGSGRLLIRAKMAAALAPLPGGGLVYGELASGRIWRLSADGRRSRRPVAQVSASTNGLRGLLGLAVDSRGRVFADWTGKDHLIHVAQVAPGRKRAIWSPGADADEANGGRLALGVDGRLIVTVGDRDRSVQPNPVGGAPLAPAFPGFSGGIFSVDPDGSPAQTPQLLAPGYFNPFGLAVTPSGQVWTTDNAVTPTGDLIARVHDGTAEPFAYMAHTAPSGLAAIDDTTLAVCGFVSRRLDRFVVGPDGTAQVSGPPIARGCTIGVIRLANGRLAYADARAIYVVAAAGGR
jgi:Glucose / Sorbosone dehydrogenase